jgi:alpha-galactosidase/6-phospho-beta-glucosidase family protein
LEQEEAHYMMKLNTIETMKNKLEMQEEDMTEELKKEISKYILSLRHQIVANKNQSLMRNAANKGAVKAVMVMYIIDDPFVENSHDVMNMPYMVSRV